MVMRLTRTGETFSYELEEKDGVSTYVGRRGLLVLGPQSWETVEIVSRTPEGRRTIPYKWLRPGTYVVEMARMRNHSRRKALRFLPDGWNGSYPSAVTFRSLKDGRIYAHGIEAPELRPDHLGGCTGLGCGRTARGVSNPMRAMLGLIDALGGWEEGRRFQLEVGVNRDGEA